VIFSQGRGSAGKHARAEERRGSGPRHAAGQGRPEPEFVDGLDDGDGFDEDEPEWPVRGPYDIVDAPDGVPRLDLGSLHIPAIDGVEVRVQASPEGAIQQVMLVSGQSALQLGAFAAPRSQGIWDEVRDEMHRSFVADRASVEETPGEYGTELRVRVRTPEGPNDLRFVGIDGPRWMVRAVYHGVAATDPPAAGPLAEVLAGLVVDRGQQPMPVRDALPLRLPREMIESQAAEAPQPPTDAADGVVPRRAPGSGRPRPSGRSRRA
jgi:hypothetical protein